MPFKNIPFDQRRFDAFIKQTLKKQPHHILKYSLQPHFVMWTKFSAKRVQNIDHDACIHNWLIRFAFEFILFLLFFCAFYCKSKTTHTVNETMMGCGLAFAIWTYQIYNNNEKLLHNINKTKLQTCGMF